MKVAKAVIPVAGLGTRFLPATKAIPKEMLNIVDRPTIQYIVEEAVSSGIKDIVLITASHKSAIEDHFDYSYELEAYLTEKKKFDLLEEVKRVSQLIEHIIAVRQKKPLGLGHAVLMAKNVVGDEPFAVLLGDDLVDAEEPCILQMLKVYERYQAPVIAVTPVPEEEVHRYGIIEGEEVEPGVFRIHRMVEKPAPGTVDSNLAIIGRYILVPEIFRLLEKTPPGHGGEIQLTDALAALAKSRPFYAYSFKGRRYDAGDKFGYLQATLAFGLKHPQLGPKLAAYIKEVAETLN
ncbi:UTP--glucose-1-phosphate uridylyltransferase GalU [Thermosulfuriphilus ammonigenes]|uniref:UTP--glucose-1-phosphate uridylyltransferase n=1 Tax=Thermosulfuriphilus ammonigenes TaxID=1936021 RepID=A0A6G7PVI1_9BACT|nr:UTP--glucose-1-phosphate uridylyltransferase GalU [Thermosulfuriphilus ammonigenes]MBA2848135.1 UTP--glucose-1-phosphate uridylyltransferase [Thermosulfuriphilus ammonigenes]QIJ71689.1 UTP--glucose-1-phosphate uridylyltransferase GalU [Thermosulfuriphilus ammonigenes]